MQEPHWNSLKDKNGNRRYQRVLITGIISHLSNEELAELEEHLKTKNETIEYHAIARLRPETLDESKKHIRQWMDVSSKLRVIITEWLNEHVK